VSGLTLVAHTAGQYEVAPISNRASAGDTSRYDDVPTTLPAASPPHACRSLTVQTKRPSAIRAVRATAYPSASEGRPTR
jgi:hypothetical protein